VFHYCWPGPVGRGPANTYDACVIFGARTHGQCDTMKKDAATDLDHRASTRESK